MNVTTSPLVTAYLADLDRALAGADPGDRAEIVDAVREHIDGALAELGASPSQAEIAAVLRRLGSADAVASAWTASERTTSPAAAASALPYGAPAPFPYGAAPGADLSGAPSTGQEHGGPVDATAPTLPTWAKVLLIAIGVVVLVPPVLGLLVFLFLMPVRAATPGWLGVGAGLVLVVASVACLVVSRRTEHHRTAWLVAGIVGLVLTLPFVVSTLGFASYSEGSSSGGPVVTVYEETPTQQTPLRMGG